MKSSRRRVHEPGLAGQVRQDAPRRLARVLAGPPRFGSSASTNVSSSPSLSSGCRTDAGSPGSDFELDREELGECVGSRQGRDVQVAELAILADLVEGAAAVGVLAQDVAGSLDQEAGLRADTRPPAWLSRAASLTCGPSLIAAACGRPSGRHRSAAARRARRPAPFVASSSVFASSRSASARSWRPTSARTKARLRTACADFGVPRDEPLGIEQGAGLERAVGRVPLVLRTACRAVRRPSPAPPAAPATRHRRGSLRAARGPRRSGPRGPVDRDASRRPAAPVRRGGPFRLRPQRRAASTARGTRIATALRPPR